MPPVQLIDSDDAFIEFLNRHESWLMERILSYSKTYGYVKYTSTLLEAWRISIVGLTQSFSLLIRASDEIPQMGPDDTFENDPASQFGLKEAQLHRSRGVNLAMFFSLFKYYRQSYVDLLEENRDAITGYSHYLHYLHRFFDRVETAYVTEWAGSDAEEQIYGLSVENRILANEKNRYLTFFDSMENPAIIIRFDGSIINYNLKAGELFFDDGNAGGYYYNSGVRSITTLFSVETLEESGPFEWHFKTMVFQITHKKLHDLSGKNEGIIILFNDITALKASEEALIVQSRHAAMGEMIRMIAHQWRQPIAAISMGINNMLVDIELGEIEAENFKNCGTEILKQTEYLSQTIDDFMNYFRSSELKEYVSVEALVREAHSIVKKRLETQEIAFELLYETEHMVQIYSRELLQVFLSLFNNASEALVEHRNNDRRISVYVDSDDEALKISVCNNGGTIPNALLGKIFEPYFSTKKEKDGTGLGLFISKTIVKRHLFGSLSVKNIDEGVCFMIKIPLHN